MEDGLRAYVVPSFSTSYEVLILVVMEDGLRVIDQIVCPGEGVLS